MHQYLGTIWNFCSAIQGVHILVCLYHNSALFVCVKSLPSGASRLEIWDKSKVFVQMSMALS